VLAQFTPWTPFDPSQIGSYYAKAAKTGTPAGAYIFPGSFLGKVPCIPLLTQSKPATPLEPSQTGYP